MSCNGCRVLRKGCSENCILRPCLQWILNPEAQGHATVFVAKFFGRAGLMSFISAVPDDQRPSLFQSLLFEAAGRTVNPVNGAVGLLWTGNWHVCQAAVETVLNGGTLRPITDLNTAERQESPETENVSGAEFKSSEAIPWPPHRVHHSRSKPQKTLAEFAGSEVPAWPPVRAFRSRSSSQQRPGSPSMNSDDSAITTCFESACVDHHHGVKAQPQLLNLFN